MHGIAVIDMVYVDMSNYPGYPWESPTLWQAMYSGVRGDVDGIYQRTIGLTDYILRWDAMKLLWQLWCNTIEGDLMVEAYLSEETGS